MITNLRRPTIEHTKDQIRWMKANEHEFPRNVQGWELRLILGPTTIAIHQTLHRNRDRNSQNTNSKNSMQINNAWKTAIAEKYNAKIIFVAFVLISNLFINTRISVCIEFFVGPPKAPTTIKQIKIHWNGRLSSFHVFYAWAWKVVCMVPGFFGRVPLKMLHRNILLDFMSGMKNIQREKDTVYLILNQNIVERRAV